MKDESAYLKGDLDTTGIFTYLKPSVESSLFRNGKVLTRRDKDGSDSGWLGVDREQHEVPVYNARRLEGGNRRTIIRNGFELLEHPLPDGGIDFFDQDRVVKTYYGQCEELVREFTGAHVFAFDHNIRSASGKQSKQRIPGGQEVQGPAHMVHGDYTLTSSPQRLRDLTQPSTSNDTLRAVLGEGKSLIPPKLAEKALAGDGRFAIINVWRNIVEEPVATHPLALCDADCVQPGELVVFEVHYAERIGENYFAKYSPRHKWFYYPHMTRDEALLIKQWDSDGHLAQTDGAEGDAASSDRAPCTFSFHSAFEDPATPDDAPDRWSMEVRCMVVYD